MRYEKKRSDFAKSAKNDSNSVLKSMGDIKISESRISNTGTIEVRIDGKSSQSFVDDDKASVTYLEGVIALGSKSTAV
jgi:hypothetical protein